MTVSATIGAVNQSSVMSARFAMLHNLVSAQAGGYYPSVSSSYYPQEWMIAMAWAYQQTGTSSYLTDCLATWGYLKTWADGNNVLINPVDTSKVYRDYVFRVFWMAAASARLLRLAGDVTDANSIISSLDTYAQAWLNKVNSGSPYSNITQDGFDASNGVGVPQWAASTLYTIGQRRRPATANGHAYEAQTNGMSAPSAPTFPTTVGATVADGDQVWKNVLSNTLWTATTAIGLGDIRIPTTANGFSYRAIVGGTTGGSEPTWTTTPQATQTDGSVTWRCVATTQQATYATYTNNGTTYPAIGSPNYDANQMLEEAAAFALLATDPTSAFNSGSLQTTALGRVTACTSLATAYQCSAGRTPIGDNIPPTDGRAMFDTEYASYAASVMTIAAALASGACHADTLLFAGKALDWLDANYSTEPIGAVHYDSSYGIDLEQITMRHAAYTLVGRTNSLQSLMYNGAFSDRSNDKCGKYLEVATALDDPDAIQATNFAYGLPLLAANLASPPGILPSAFFFAA